MMPSVGNLDFTRSRRGRMFGWSCRTTPVALGTFLRYIEEGEIEPGTILLVESLDRLSRNTVTKQMGLLLRIMAAGVEVVTMIDGKRYADKLELQKRLKALDDELNRHLAGECAVKIGDKLAYDKWLKSHQPFHWFIQFYGIMNGGGFDVIIGNPPYAEIPKDLGRLLLRKTFKTALERWSRDEDLYTL